MTFATFNFDNVTSANIGWNYGIQYVPAVLVIRGDGAVANFTGAYAGINTIKSAIEEAQKWQQSHSTQATVEPTQPAILVSAYQVTVPQQISTFTPKTGYKFVGFYCTVRNVAAERLSVNQYDWQLRDTVGGVYKPTIASFSPGIGGLELVATQPGDIVSGKIVYEVPQNVQLKSLTYIGSSNWVTINL